MSGHFFRGYQAMIILTLGYLVMGLIFLIVRFFYHIFLGKRSPDNLVRAIREDLISLYNYAKQIVVSNPKKAKVVVVIMVCLIILPMTPLRIDIEYAAEDFLSTIMFIMFSIVFAPQKDSSDKGFPVEIFGFIYSIIFTFYSAGNFVIDVFYASEFLKDDMWIYGYIVTLISYVVCIVTLSQFMKRDLSKQEIILLGMMMMTTLEFIIYYGIGVFGAITWYTYDPFTYDASLSNIFGDITIIINHGILLASQSQADISDSDIWGYVILNGTDVLTVTAVLGYLVQKFMDK